MTHARETSPAEAAAAASGTLVRRHRLSTRVWHWVNVVAFVIMLMSGLMIFNAHPRLHWGDYGANYDPAWLEIGSDDGVKVWQNGQVIHSNQTTRALQQVQDKVTARLEPGRNLFVFKVDNGNGGGGFALGVRASEPVEVKTE